MRFFTPCNKKAIALLPFLLLSLGNAFPHDNQKRTTNICNIAPTSDGPTSDKSAGIGVEFECHGIQFQSTCSKAETNAAKGKMVGNRQGTNWKLTADTTLDLEGNLVAEYILDGTTIKIGAGTAAKAAKEVASDLKAWDPSTQAEAGKIYEIEDNTCKWTLLKPAKAGAALCAAWLTQVTAPMPLAAINDLYGKAYAKTSNALLPSSSRPYTNMVYVTKEFFQSTPNGIAEAKITADALGFFSLILSYAKGAATRGTAIESPKTITSIMPRTDFTTMYNEIKSSISMTGTLYSLVEVLACYKNYGDDGTEIEIDQNYCTGTVAAPKPISKKLDAIEFKYSGIDSLNVKAWIESIEKGTVPDELTTWDKKIDSSIGGLGTNLEYMHGTTRAVPLFEFRNLASVTMVKMEAAVTAAENAIIALHKTYATSGKRSVSSTESSKRATTSTVCE